MFTDLSGKTWETAKIPQEWRHIVSAIVTHLTSSSYYNQKTLVNWCMCLHLRPIQNKRSTLFAFMFQVLGYD